METGMSDRRGFLTKLAAVLGGLAVIPALAQSARASRGRYRGGWGGGSGRRYYGGGGYYGGGYGGYGGGYGGYAPRYYAPVPRIYAPGYGGGYGGGYYYRSYGGYGGYGGFPGPIMKLDRPKAIDALSLLEA